MKKLFLPFLLTTFLSAETLVDGLERASAPQKMDACKAAKDIARKNYDVKDMNVGCTCERSDAHEWICFVGFKYLPKKD